MGRVRKEGFRLIWLEKRVCVQSKEMAWSAGIMR